MLELSCHGLRGAAAGGVYLFSTGLDAIEVSLDFVCAFFKTAVIQCVSNFREPSLFAIDFHLLPPGMSTFVWTLY